MSVAIQMDFAAAAPQPQPHARWYDVCALDDVPANCGAPALIAGRQVALVRVQGQAPAHGKPEEQAQWKGDDLGGGDAAVPEIYALSNFDPFSEAFVIARGIVGDRAGCPKIASPIYKQSFDLRTGVCFDDPRVVLATYAARVRNGRIEVAVAAALDADESDGDDSREIDLNLSVRR